MTATATTLEMLIARVRNEIAFILSDRARGGPSRDEDLARRRAEPRELLAQRERRDG
jgi:hypothetical protein